MRDGERQVAPTLKDIRRDHVARYEWATRTLPQGARVVDFACGVGYGSWILAATGFTVEAFDNDPEAIAYARKHYAHRNATFAHGDARAPATLGKYDAAICFETIEHVAEPRVLLRALARAAPLLLASVPNEEIFPFGEGVEFHFRHYTRAEFVALLRECGWKIRNVYGQSGSESPVEFGVMGRTLVCVADRIEANEVEQPADDVAAMLARVAPLPSPPPAHVAIVGLGPSAAQYDNVCKRLGGRHAFCDETWALNSLGDVLACDRVFHMDDVRVQQIRADAAPTSNIARMLEWMRTHKGPIYTSRPHPEFPGTVAFPLEAVANATGYAYFNNTAAYAVAFALYIGVKRISLFGCDYTYPNAHDAERGRACLEFWLGYAAARGVKIAMPRESTLMDALAPFDERIYGYDTLEVSLPQDASGKFRATFVARATLPTADEIEARYDHGVHPNRIVANTTEG